MHRHISAVNWGTYTCLAEPEEHAEGYFNSYRFSVIKIVNFSFSFMIQRKSIGSYHQIVNPGTKYLYWQACSRKTFMDPIHSNSEALHASPARYTCATICGGIVQGFASLALQAQNENDLLLRVLGRRYNEGLCVGDSGSEEFYIAAGRY